MSIGPAAIGPDFFWTLGPGDFIDLDPMSKNLDTASRPFPRLDAMTKKIGQKVQLDLLSEYLAVMSK